MASNRRARPPLPRDLRRALRDRGVPRPRQPVTGPPAVAGTPPRPAQASTHAPAPPQAGSAADFVGDDTCTACHESEGKIAVGARCTGRRPTRGTPAARTNQACETCHGPGREHAESGTRRRFASFPRWRLTTRRPCASPATTAVITRAGRAAGTSAAISRAARATACTARSRRNGSSSRRPQTQLCATCHRLQVSKTERAVAHMPVREGKMSCSSCHNPHGSISNVKNLKTGSSVAELCTSCHTEMRGPMLFEHAPVRENCATCHDPHGSSNDRMLVVRMPMLCQRCHIASKHPATLYDKDQITTNKSNRMFGRSCVNCHSNVHGSNHPSGQFFMR